MPYRTPSDPRIVAPECPVGDQTRHRTRVAKAFALAAAAIALTAVAFDVYTRPVLGSYEDYELVADVPMPPIQVGGTRFTAFADRCEIGPASDDDYDVDRALRSDEPTWGDYPPEGEGPARLRYVRPNPDEGIIRATVSLVADRGRFNHRPRRRL